MVQGVFAGDTSVGTSFANQLSSIKEAVIANALVIAEFPVNVGLAGKAEVSVQVASYTGRLTR